MESEERDLDWLEQDDNNVGCRGWDTGAGLQGRDEEASTLLDEEEGRAHGIDETVCICVAGIGIRVGDGTMQIDDVVSLEEELVDEEDGEDVDEHESESLTSSEEAGWCSMIIAQVKEEKKVKCKD